ncbi:ABC transporter A family member 1 [Vitis vinifera]|uniref:ABC transporter A family member 1 n=1 Tax=Vitis vinifera TaxID=29760 RepID=A0A438BZZ7_VITVI|nr:ABC transporter A family member 1 [Vitis vinifera]
MGRQRAQLKAMLRKNWLLKIRHPFVTCAEILLPTVVMLMLIAVRTQVDTKVHSAQPYVRKGMFVEVGKGDVSPSFGQVLELLLAKVTRVYKDELELDTYIRSDLYGTCNQVKIPDVKTIMDTNGPYLNDLELGVDAVPTLQYSFSGFLTLQQVLDSFIIFAAQQNEANMVNENIELPSNTSLIKQSWMQFIPSNIKIVPFPTREYTDDEFQSIIKSVMGLLYLLGFLYPISRLISYSVFEKEQKIKESLYMMGLKDEIFHLSWFITYALQFAVTSGIITACTMDTLFQYSDKSLVFIYFFLFGLSAIMLSFLISTFFTRAKTAVAVGTLSFLGAFFPYYTVNDQAVPMILKFIASLLSPTAFALGSINFADYERAYVGLRWSNVWRGEWSPFAMELSIPEVFMEKEKFIKHEDCSFDFKNDRRKVNFCSNDISGPAVEAISLDMKQQELDGRCIQIRNLHKVYATKREIVVLLTHCDSPCMKIRFLLFWILALLGEHVQF